MVRSKRLRIALGVVALVGVSGACSEEEAKGLLQEQDLKQEPGVEAVFDKNNLIDPAAFTDTEGIDGALVQKFLHRTPYARPSFLETYQSNGVRAADAVMNAARTYKINPLVFLVYAQATQGLLGEIYYPFPPERVEYVFRCGCLVGGESCLPELAGFDRQVDCLGRAFRKALDDIAASGATPAGWGPDRPGTTLDGQKVTPANDATAALYDRTPAVFPGEAGGSWLFWNVWNLYAAKIDYVGPLGGAGSGQWIGDACVAPESCGFDSPICATNYPDGLCTTSCDGSCPSAADRDEAFCAAFAEGGFCLQVCNPGAPNCRAGYKCTSVARFNGASSESKHVCFPEGVQ